MGIVGGSVSDRSARNGYRVYFEENGEQRTRLMAECPLLGTTPVLPPATLR